MLKKIKIFLEMIKFEHTIFALPFAYLGTLLGSVVIRDTLPTWPEIGWITLAMIGARSSAMALNRFIDRAIDKKNPRTANRAIPAGLLRNFEVILFIVLSFALLFYSASKLTPLAFQLLPIAVFFLVFYSYTKRFTWSCHFFLGITIALAPLGGWVAVTGQMNAEGLLLFLTVAFWIAGFDIIYACQDTEFDREEGLHSIPARFGVAAALWVARGCHLLTAIGLITLFAVTQLGGWYLLGIVITYLLLLYEHSLITAKDLSKLNTAFFSINGVISIILFVFTLIDLTVFNG
jgi:4-hydroxybenzoate polyprenyltransferase